MIVKANWTMRVLLISIAFSSSCFGEKENLGYDIPTWSFCVAYVIRDADKRDERPIEQGEEDPFDGGPTFVADGSLLLKKGIVDVAGLASRAVAQKTLNKGSAQKVLKATLRGNAKYPLTSCYEPHHIFIFYTSRGLPVYSIEVCFKCNRVKMQPELKDTRGLGSIETADLHALAKVFDDAKLSLTPLKTLNEKKGEKSAEQAVPPKSDRAGG